MRLRSLGAAAVAAVVMQSCQPACAPTPAPPPAAAPATPPAPPPPPTSLTIAGQGNGHGRGLSAWGAYGMAVNEAASWQRIIDKYYGATSWANTGNRPLGVRLLWADGRPDTTVVSMVGAVTWSGGAGSYGSMHAFQVAANVYDVYGASGIGCAGSAIDWAFIGRFNGPITFSTPLDETAASPGDVLGVCRPDGSITHYRGAIQAITDGTTSRTVNVLLIENYLRGVLPREVPATWGRSGGGAGMNALWAMAVAARSFAHSQGRYWYAHTCDTDACQVYGGAARRSSVAAAPDSVCAEAGNASYECTPTNRAVRETENVVRVRDGRIISGEYSASHGPYSSGVNFPAVDDAASNVAGNNLYVWSRTIAAADLVARWPQIGTFTGAWSEREPGSSANGVWGNRIVLQGTAGTVAIGNLAFRNAFGFPSHGFAVSSVN